MTRCFSNAEGRSAKRLRLATLQRWHFELSAIAVTIDGHSTRTLQPHGDAMSDDMLPIQKLDILRAACCVAGIDGDVNEPQTKVIQRLANEVGVGKASLDAMIARAETDETFHEEQFKVLKFEPKATMTALLQVALADGDLSDPEIRVLRILGNRLEIEAPLFDQLIAAVRQQL